MRPAAIAVSLSAFLYALAAPARAEDEVVHTGELVRVAYSAPATCPGQGEFESALVAELGTAAIARNDELARSLIVRIEPEGGGFHAWLSLVDRDGRSTGRDLVAASCQEAMQAIALVAALAARSQELPAAASDPAPRSVPSDTIAPHGEPATAPAAGARASARPTPQAARTEPSLEVESLLAVSAATGIGPTPALGLALEARLVLDRGAKRSVSLSLFAYDTTRTELEVASARFTLLGGRLDLCPHELRVSRAAGLDLCGGFELGSQTGRSYADETRVEDSGIASRAWAALATSLRVRLETGRLRAYFGPELRIPLLQNRFALAPEDLLVHEVPPVAFGLSAAAGWGW